MAGYTRVDTSNNIADGNVISAADLDNEFDGIQAAFNASTGHNHDGTTGEGAPILVLGPTQDVVVGASTVTPKTTNTVDIGSSSLKFKDLYLAGNASIAGTLAVTGATTFSGTVTGNGNWVLGNADTDTITQSASYVNGTKLRSAKTATNTLALAAYDVNGAAYTDLVTLTASNTPTLALTSTGVGTIDNMSVGATTASTGAFTTLTTSSTVTHNGGTANGVAFLNGSKVLTTGSALTFDGTALRSSTYLGLATNTTPDTSTGEAIFYKASAGATLSGFNLVFETGSAGSRSEQMRLTSTGLGIGTSSPANKLHVVYGGSAVGAQFTASAGYAQMQLTAAGANQNAYYTFNVNGTGKGIIQVNATDVLTLDSSGNLGLGVTPSAWSGVVPRALQFQYGCSIAAQSNAYNLHFLRNAYFDNGWKYLNSAAAVRFALNDDAGSGGFAWFTAPSGTAGNAITFTQSMTLDASGRLLVGSTSSTGASAKLVVGAGLSGTDAVTVINTADADVSALMLSNWDGSATSYGPRVAFDNSGRGSFIIGGSDASNNFDICRTWGTPDVRIDSSGNLLVGTTSAYSNPSAYGSVNIHTSSGINIADTSKLVNDKIIFGSAEYYILNNSGVGVYLASGNTSWSAQSDERLKDIIEPITDAATKVSSLRAVIGKFKADAEGTRRSFLIAQDVQAVLPEAVNVRSDEMGTLGVQYSDVIPLLVAAIKELKAELDTVKAELTTLKGN